MIGSTPGRAGGRPQRATPATLAPRATRLGARPIGRTLPRAPFCRVPAGVRFDRARQPAAARDRPPRARARLARLAQRAGQADEVGPTPILALPRARA